jgi:hypothetical protein
MREVLPLEVVAAVDKLWKATGAWKDEDHPELKDGTAAWVRKIRAESEERFRRIEDQRDRD